jgi:two-component system, chemotaxis family, sensor kinase CheA
LHPLARRQLRKSYPDTLPESPELHALIAAVSDAYAAGDAEREQLESSVALASEELFARNRALEHQVAELTRLEQDLARRTADLDRRNHEMALILDHVAQGFVTVGLDGAISSECSLALTRWFGPASPELRIWTLLVGHDPNLAAWMQLVFESLRADVMPLDVVLGQLPARIDRDDRHYRVEYRPIGDPLVALLVVVSDITGELARERAETTQRELLAVVEHAYRDRAGFLAFVHDTDELLGRCEAVDVALDELKRLIHTLKGNAALFGVLTISRLCHALETQIEDTAASPDRAARAVLFDAWRAFHDQVDTLLGVSERRTILIDWEDYQSILALLDEPDPSRSTTLRRLAEDTTRGHLERLGDHARQLSRRLGKAELDVEIHDHGLSIDRDRFAPLWAALVHTVRNAVDHGIETGPARAAAAKPVRGRLRLITELRGAALVIEIQDDGAGVDWHAVALRASALGLRAASAAELREAVFASGLSTAQEITEISGRGIGLGALRAACGELGGHVELTSERGCGTTVRCVVPLVAHAVDLDLPAHARAPEPPERHGHQSARTV